MASFPTVSGYVVKQVASVSGDGEFVGVRLVVPADPYNLSGTTVGVYDQVNTIVEDEQGGKVVLTEVYVSGDIGLVSGVVIVNPVIHIKAYMFQDILLAGTTAVQSGSSAKVSGVSIGAMAPVGGNAFIVTPAGPPDHIKILSFGQ